MKKKTTSQTTFTFEQGAIISGTEGGTASTHIEKKRRNHTLHLGNRTEILENFARQTIQTEYFVTNLSLSPTNSLFPLLLSSCLASSFSRSLSSTLPSTSSRGQLLRQVFFVHGFVFTEQISPLGKTPQSFNVLLLSMFYSPFCTMKPLTLNSSRSVLHSLWWPFFFCPSIFHPLAFFARALP